MRGYHVFWSTGSLQGVVDGADGRPILYPDLATANVAVREEFAAMAGLDATDRVVPHETVADGALSLTDSTRSAPDLAVWAERTEEE